VQYGSMTPFQVFFSTDFIIAASIYAIAIMCTIPWLSRLRTRLESSVLHWYWDHIFIPLVQVVLLALFLLLAYPVIFGMREAPSIFTLLSHEELRFNKLVNLLFLLTLLFPLLPGAVKWQALILPLQGIAASMLIFSWHALEAGFRNVNYWPGTDTFFYILLLSILTYWLASIIAKKAGGMLDRRYHLLDSGKLIQCCIILYLQSPAILVFSLRIGRQIQ